MIIDFGQAYNYDKDVNIVHRNVYGNDICFDDDTKLQVRYLD